MKKIFYNGKIVTMEKDIYVEAVLIDDDTIEKVGDVSELKIISPNAELIDLNGKTMLPAFIDAHGHFSSYANAQLQVSLDEVATFDEIAEKIKYFIKSNNTETNKWVIAKGYDHNTLLEKCHPDKEFLDNISPNNPLIIQHQSGHCGVLNSKALEILGITKETKATSGGLIGRLEGELTGYMEEEAYISCIKKVPIADFKEMLEAYDKAQKKYLSYGITTIQEGMMVTQMIPLYKELIKSNMLSVDIIGYPDMSSMKDIVKEFSNSLKKYDRHFKIGGYKIFLDGSPQVKTAWMQKPYKDNEDYCGYGTMNDADVLSAVEQSVEDNIQILAHCNGDAAIQQYINAIRKVANKNEKIKKLKPVIIHSQLITKEQLEEVSKLKMIPSFFIAHVLHWGDIHIKNFGYDRAKCISPAKEALNKQIVFTFHQDAPVIEPNMLETIQIAVTRKTKSGVTLGEEECISVMDAIKAVTINVAYQYSEEDIKGSISIGKQADFVILNENPLEVKKEEISNIKIIETIKAGKTVFKNPLTKIN